MFRNRKERFRPGRRWLAIVLLPAIPAMAAGVMSGDRDIFWGQLAVEFYALFLLTAICSRDFAEVYQKLALETPAESRGVRKAKRWLCGLLHSLVRGFVYDIPAGIGDGERNRRRRREAAMKQMASGFADAEERR